MTEDPRVRRALELLREVLAEGATPPGDDAWESALGPPSEPWLPSATDLLVTWHPEAAVAAWPARAPAEAWDSYFGVEAPRAPEPGPATAAAPVTPAPALEVPGEWLSGGGADVEPPLPAHAKEDAVDALYAFLHALERRDVDAALEHVADDYHVLEAEREVDRAGLRRQLEAFLDPLREGLLRIAPVRIPEPIAHPAGVLVRLSLAVDHEPGAGRRPESQRLERLAFFEAGPEGRWRLGALADVERRA